MDKEYLCVSLDKMYFFNDDTYKPTSKMNKVFLSDGTEVKLFFELTSKKSIGSYFPETHAKEILTKRTYSVSLGFKSRPGFLIDRKYGTITYEGDGYQEFFLGTINKDNVLSYLQDLREKGIYKEYAKEIDNFYKLARMNKRKISVIK